MAVLSPGARRSAPLLLALCWAACHGPPPPAERFEMLAPGEFSCAGRNCDDGNACTQDACNGAAGCSHGPLTGTSCDDGSPCSVDDACAAGSCVTGPEVLFTVRHGGPAWDIAYAVAGLSDGGAMASGSRGFPEKTAGVAFVVRVSRTGKVLWNHELSDGIDSSYRGLVAVGDDGVAVCGEILVDSGGGSFWIALLARLGPDGSVRWHRAIPGADGRTCRHLLNAPSDRLLLIGEGSDGKSIDGWLALHDKQGEEIWSKLYDFGGADYLRAGVVLADGGAVVGGRSSVAKQPITGVMARIDAKGELLWQKAFATGAGTGVQDLQALPDGLVFAGYSAADGWIGRISLDGEVAWQRTVAAPAGPSQGERVAVLGDKLVLMGLGGDHTIFHTRLTGLDLVGNIHWDRTLAADVSDQGMALAPVPGGLLVAGSVSAHPKDSSKDDAWIARVDAFGNASCGTGAACVARAADGCDDGNPCTADRCDIGAGTGTLGGCRHTQLAIGALCAVDGSKQCDDKGACH